MLSGSVSGQPGCMLRAPPPSPESSVSPLVLCLLPALHAGVEWGVAPATQKILPATALPAATSAHVQAARGEWEGFQIMLISDGDVATLDATISALEGPDGAVIEASEAQLYREWYLDIQQASSMGATEHEREPGLYPDPLIPLWDPWSDEARPVGAALPLAGGEVGALFVDLWVPRDQAAGIYTGNLRVDADGESWEIPVELEVWDLEIPLERTIATAFNTSTDAYRNYHGGAGDEAEDGYDEIAERYFLALHEHRIDPTHLNADIDFAFDEQGQLEPVDWAAYDAYMAPWLDGSKFPDGVGSTRFDIERFRPGSGLGDWTEHEYQQAAVAFAEHLEEQGWWEKAYIYASDEPWLRDEDESYAEIHEDAQRLFEASPLYEGKVLVTGPYDERIEGDIGIWCPVTPMYETWFWGEDICATLDHPCAGRTVYDERMALGEQLWFYACNANFPPFAGYDIDTTIGYEPRIVKWGAWYEGSTGFLYWRTTYWIDDDPWNRWANYDNFGTMAARNGDGILFYPGDHDGTAATGSPEGIAIDGPVVSYRLKQVRDGLEDWEMMILADELGGGDYVREQVARAHTRFGDAFIESCDDDDVPQYYCPDDQPWTLDQDLLLEVRANIAAKILFLQDPDSWPDPEEAPADTGGADGQEGCAGCATRGRPGGAGLLAMLLVAMAARRRRT